MDLQDIVTKLGFSGRMLLICGPCTVFFRVHSSNRIQTVAPFLSALRSLLARDRAHGYPGSQTHWFLKYAWFGGLVFYWLVMGLREGLFEDSLNLFASGWLLLLIAAVRRMVLILLGRHPIENLRLGTPEARFHVPLLEVPVLSTPSDVRKFGDWPEDNASTPQSSTSQTAHS